MTGTALTLDDCPSVRAVINYIGAMDAQPYMYYRDPPAGARYTNIIDEPHEVSIADVRDEPGRLVLDEDKIAFVNFDHGFDDFDDDAAVREEYFSLVQNMFRELLNVDRVLVFDYAVRRPDHGPERPNGIPVAGPRRRPILRAHGDFIRQSFRELVGFMGDAAGPDPLAGRHRTFNFWRPLRGPLTDRPLAFCHPSTVSQDDIVPMRQFNDPRDNYIYALRHSPRHRWLFLSKMMENEGAIFSSYDSNHAEAGGVVAHSAFEHPDHSATDLDRESIEVRVMVFGE